MSKAGGLAAFLVVLGTAAEVGAQQGWNAPFGGTWSATLALLSEYSYRGISLTERQPGILATIGYELPIVPDKVHLYLETWGANVHFSPAVATEVTASASLIFYALDRKLSVWLSVSRFNYLEAPRELSYNYNEFALWAGYDFGAMRLSGTLAYSPSYYADSGAAWYKQAEVSVPLKFIPLDEGIALKAFASVGNQYIERYLNSGLPGDNYWDWEIGLRARVFQVDMALSYVDTNLDVAGCSNTRNCEGRVILKMSKTF